MSEPTSVDGLSPLDQIRLAEAEITRKVVTAREAVERAIVEARTQATLLKKQAQETGTREGQICYKEIVAGAEEEARGLVAHAHDRASVLRLKGQARMEAAIREAVSIVLGLRGGGTSDES
jgi:vacuolar-type H+-ATPase subunit H